MLLLLFSCSEPSTEQESSKLQGFATNDLQIKDEAMPLIHFVLMTRRENENVAFRITLNRNSEKITGLSHRI